MVGVEAVERSSQLRGKGADDTGAFDSLDLEDEILEDLEYDCEDTEGEDEE